MIINSLYYVCKGLQAIYTDFSRSVLTNEVLILTHRNERIFEYSFVLKKVRSLHFEYSFRP